MRGGYISFLYSCSVLISDHTQPEMALPGLQRLCINAYSTEPPSRERDLYVSNLPVPERRDKTSEWKWEDTYKLDNEECLYMKVTVTRQACPYTPDGESKPKGSITITVWQKPSECDTDKQFVKLITVGDERIPDSPEQVEVMKLSGLDSERKWRKVRSTCHHTIQKAIWCIVDSLKQRMPRLGKITYSDTAIIGYQRTLKMQCS